MIVTKNEMIAIEQKSNLQVLDLMEQAGTALANAILEDTSIHDTILLLCGKGNNGGDGFVIARLLQNKRKIRIYLVDGKPTSKTALTNYELLDSSLFISPVAFVETLQQSTVVIDAVYGFSYHGSLKPHISSIFKQVNHANKKVLSVDINSGCECDTLNYDSNAIQSTITYALDCYKPFHMYRKEHNLFTTVKCLPLNLPHPNTTIYQEMNEETFFKQYPYKNERSYKGSFGKTVLIGGCFGMAGALSLNITGAKAMGSSYIQVGLSDRIYPILATKHTTPVFCPFGDESWYSVIERLIQSASAIGYGSGATYLNHKEAILDLLLQNATCPIVLDAEALRLLKHNTYILRYAKAPVILTPHLGEFSDLCNLPIETIQDHPIECMKTFVQDYKVNLVLKGPHTICMFTNGQIYINQSGNESLATAGSGDVLTGMITSLLTRMNDVNQAVIMAVYMHGHLTDLSNKTHSKQLFDLESIPQLMDELFMKYEH